MPAGEPTPERFVSRPARAVALGAILVCLVAVMTLVIPVTPLAIDTTWSDAMADIQSSFLEHVARLFGELGRPLGVVLTIVAIGIPLAVRRRWVGLATLVLAQGIAFVASAVLKLVADRPRPPDGLVHAAGSSFPSGHATYAGATCVMLVLLFSSPGRRLPACALAALGVIVMAWSRTYLQVHWLSDVVGGSVLGAGVALIVASGVQAWDERRRTGVQA